MCFALFHVDTCSPAQPGQRTQSRRFLVAPWPHAHHEEWSVLSMGSFGISKGQLLGNRRCFSNHQWRREEKERWEKGVGGGENAGNRTVLGRSCFWTCFWFHPALCLATSGLNLSGCTYPFSQLINVNPECNIKGPFIQLGSHTVIYCEMGTGV